MAYFNLLASVCDDEIEQLRRDPGFCLNPSLVLASSHLIAYWVDAQPLGRLLAAALDDGELIHPEFWHPLRPPVFHRSEHVRELADQIGVAWNAMAQGDEWLVTEVRQVMRLFRHAAAGNECVVSALDPPGDADRGRRV